MAFWRASMSTLLASFWQLYVELSGFLKIFIFSFSFLRLAKWNLVSEVFDTTVSLVSRVDVVPMEDAKVGGRTIGSVSLAKTAVSDLDDIEKTFAFLYDCPSDLILLVVALNCGVTCRIVEPWT